MNRMFRRIALMSAAILLLVALSLPALAEETPVGIAVSTAEGTAGGNAAVTLELTETAGVVALQCNLNYDPNALKVASVEPGDIFPAEYTVTNTGTPGLIRVACAALSVGEDGVVLTVHFQVTGASAVTVSDGVVTRYSEETGQTEAYVAVTDGGVTMGSALPAPVVTPWIPATPVPTPSPSPTPTPAPTAMDITSMMATPEPSATPEPEAKAAEAGPVSYVMVAVLAAACVLLIWLEVQTKRNKKTGKNRRRR